MTGPETEFVFKRPRRFGRGTLVANVNGDCTHTDELKVTDAAARRRFAKDLCEKVPALDLDSVMGVLDDLAASEASRIDEVDQANDPPSQTARYESTEQGIVHYKPGSNDPVPLTNFQAWIVADVLLDNGVEIIRAVEIDAKLGKKKSRFTIPASAFAKMDWVARELGPQAVVYAGYGLRDHVRVAIQTLSKNIETKRVFTHTGWRKIEEETGQKGEGSGSDEENRETGIWVFLHSGGVIGPDPPYIPDSTDNNIIYSIYIDIPNSLRRYSLQNSVNIHTSTAVPGEIGDRGTATPETIQECLCLLDLAPKPITVSLLAAVFRSVLGDPDMTIHLAGATGVFKTEVAALFQSFFGASMDSRNLPGSWSSTGNSLEELGFMAKDVLVVVDDFAPSGNRYDIQRYHRKADRLLRAQGNRSGRGRCRSDGTLKHAHAPRCLFLSTGEDIPAGHSLRARMLVLELKNGDIDPDALSSYQQAAAQGIYARTMAGFLAWIAGQYESRKKQFHDRIADLQRKAAKEGRHRRTSNIVAQLYVSLEIFADYAVENGAIDPKKADLLKEEWWSALCENAAVQEDHHRASEPTSVFFRLLSAALASGEAHIANTEGECPNDSPKSLGWQKWKHPVQEYTEWKSKGPLVGWIDDDGLYLIPEASYKAAQKMASDTERITVPPKTLAKRLAERGLLVTREAQDQRNTVQKQVQGVRKRVLHVSLHNIHTEDQPEGGKKNRPVLDQSTQDDNVEMSV